jgi:1-acyl-sn-glycerol-3-phosphate acyltransferase
VIPILNALIGLFLFERSWYRTRRFRENLTLSTLNQHFPAYARTDVHKWSKICMYPCALTLLVPRVIVAAGFPFMLAVWCRILICCTDREQPITGCRRWMIKFMFWAWGRSGLLLGFATLVRTREIDVDDEKVNYEEWLGPNYKEALAERKKQKTPTSTIVMNHPGLLEIIAVVSGHLSPALCGKVELSKIPLFSALAFAVQGVFLKRGAGDAMIQQIIDRQKQIEKDKIPFNPVCIFAEGTSNNNTHLLPFKKGAFAGEYTIKPVFAKIEGCGMVSSCYDILGFVDLVCLLICSMSVYTC